jgi:hypothetical protein
MQNPITPIRSPSTSSCATNHARAASMSSFTRPRDASIIVRATQMGRGLRALSRSGITAT